MDNIKDILKNKKLERKSIERWQDLAIQIKTTLVTKPYQIGSVFKCCKTNLVASERAFNDCKELNKNNVNYFFKVWNVYNGNQTNS